MKFQGINLRIYETFDKLKTKEQKNIPSFDIKLETLVIEKRKNFVDNSQT